MSVDLKLYHGLASTCSKKVRMCLYEKSIPFESHLLDLQKFEQHRPEYLAINPNGVVPAIVHDGKPVIESSIIIEYLDECFPDTPLKPMSAHDRALMRLWIKFSDEIAYKAVYAPTWNRLRHRAEAGLSDEARSDTLARVPTVERRERWERMANGGYSDEELAKAYDQMKSCMDRAETSLKKSRWLVGNEFSLADIAVLPFIDRIANLRPDFLEGEEYSALKEWVGRCRERPAFEKAFHFTDDPRAHELPNF